MIKLLRADFLRLFRSVMFWLAVLVVIGFSFFAVNENRYIVNLDSFDHVLFLGTTYICFLMAIVISTFVGSDYRYGTIRNKISVGNTRPQIYFSNYIVCIVASLILHTLWLAAIIGSSEAGILGRIAMSGRNLAILIFISYLIIIAFVSVFMLTSMIIPSIALSIIASMVIAVSMTYLSAWLDMRLSEPEYITVTKYGDIISSYYDEFGALVQEVETENIEYKNPQYVSGFRRKVYMFLFYTLPNAQVMHLNAVTGLQASGAIDEEVTALVDEELVLPLYSLLFIFITTAAGAAVFRIEDIK